MAEKLTIELFQAIRKKMARKSRVPIGGYYIIVDGKMINPSYTELEDVINEFRDKHGLPPIDKVEK